VIVAVSIALVVVIVVVVVVPQEDDDDDNDGSIGEHDDDDDDEDDGDGDDWKDEEDDDGDFDDESIGEDDSDWRDVLCLVFVTCLVAQSLLGSFVYSLGLQERGASDAEFRGVLGPRVGDAKNAQAMMTMVLLGR
jgi:hypothetical protein